MHTLIISYNKIMEKLSLYLTDLTLLIARLLVANVFFSSGMTKWNGFFSFNPEKYDLFLYEFFCPDPIREGALLLCDAETLDYVEGSSIITFIETLAVGAGVAEIVFPILLALGIFARVGAVGLIAMTLFIQLAVFPSWDHWWNPAVWWFVVLMAVLSMGPGRLSLDSLLGLEKKR
ncbi:DoxX family protein [Paraglaciecola sp. 2405UD69-4]|uniref:DoxX family protein n=1 Tax=Paraglaciecola sp. 2405UD69-4 TaxID=3391836 RepID=UPI0039C9670C